jgi:hypothetical protein
MLYQLSYVRVAVILAPPGAPLTRS